MLLLSFSQKMLEEADEPLEQFMEALVLVVVESIFVAQVFELVRELGEAIVQHRIIIEEAIR